MGEYTLLRVDVDAGVVAMILDAVPGVEVDGRAIEPDDGSAEAPVSESGGRRPPAGATRTASETPPPSVAPVPEDDGGIAALVRRWWLLGVGVALVAGGTAAAGLWWYRQRGEADETEPVVETPTATPQSSERSSFDAAPLLGMGFLAAVTVLVRQTRQET